MAPARVSVLAGLCLLFSVVALHVEARQLPDCGPLGKHRFRCVDPGNITGSVQANPEEIPDCSPLGKDRYQCGNPPRIITRSLQANLEQPPTTDIHEASSIQLADADSTHASPASAHELSKREIGSGLSSSGAAHDDGVGGVSTTSSIAEDPECGPLEKNRYRCGNPPRIRVRDINALG